MGHATVTSCEELSLSSLLLGGPHVSAFWLLGAQNVGFAQGRA